MSEWAPLALLKWCMRMPILDDRFHDRGDGTFAPFSRASLKPMAMACLRLFTVRPDPLLSVPRLRRRIADATAFDAALPYFAMLAS